MRGMRNWMMAAMLMSGMAGSAAETLSDAEIYVKVKTEVLEKEKTAAIAAAKADAERDTALKQMAVVGDLKRELIGNRARVAELQQKYDDYVQILKAIPPAPTPPTPARWGQPAFADDFAVTKLSDKWKGVDGKSNVCQIVEGMLMGKGKLSLAPVFNGLALRVEYDTFTASETPGEAGVRVEAPEMPAILASVGSEGNKECRLKIGNEEVARKDGAVLKSLRRQRVVVELGEGKARIEVDGVLVVEYAGEKVPKELKAVTLSLVAPVPGTQFDTVRVFVVK